MFAARICWNSGWELSSEKKKSSSQPGLISVKNTGLQKLMCWDYFWLLLSLGLVLPSIAIDMVSLDFRLLLDRGLPIWQISGEHSTFFHQWSSPVMCRAILIDREVSKICSNSESFMSRFLPTQKTGFSMHDYHMVLRDFGCSIIMISKVLKKVETVCNKVLYFLS